VVTIREVDTPYLAFGGGRCLRGGGAFSPLREDGIDEV